MLSGRLRLRERRGRVEWHFPCSMRPARRILGLPVDAALIIAGVLVVLALFAGVVIPGARRRDRARDGGTYSGDRRRG